MEDIIMLVKYAFFILLLLSYKRKMSILVFLFPVCLCGDKEYLNKILHVPQRIFFLVWAKCNAAMQS